MLAQICMLLHSVWLYNKCTATTPAPAARSETHTIATPATQPRLNIFLHVNILQHFCMALAFKVRASNAQVFVHILAH